MAGRFKLNPLEMLTLAAVIFTTWLFLQAALDAAEMYTTVGGPISQANQMLGIFGWMVATFGPIGLALVFWRLAKRFRGRWILHLLFLPCTYFLLWAGAGIMGYVTQDYGFDHTLGGPVLQAMALSVFIVPAYFGAILLRWLANRWRRT